MGVQFAWFENAGHNLEYFHVIATRGQNLTFSISGTPGTPIYLHQRQKVNLALR